MDEENAARAARRGLWAGEFTAPWEYRQSRRGDSGAAPVAPSVLPAPKARKGCLIKGNISDSGKIYHMPGSSHYDETKIDERNGERWFCTEQEARAAGWRAARG